MSEIHGIDAEYNPDWQQWKGRVAFAGTKATEGLTFINPDFAENWAQMKECGYARFAYHVAHPTEDPSRQVQFFLEVVKAQGLEQHDQFYLDLEPLIVNGLKAVDVSFWADVFCQEINRQCPGHHIMVYSDVDLASRGYCARLGNRAWWVADYEVGSPEMAGPWKDWVIWQQAGGNVVDLDVFNGDAERLAWFVNT